MDSGVGLEPTTSRLTAERICQIELPRTALPRTDRPGSFGDGSDSSLDFRMAVGAQEDALGRLGPGLRRSTA